MDVANNACGQFEIVDAKAFHLKYVRDWELSKCNGVFGFANEDIPKVMDWCSDLVKLAEKNCSSK